ncbi:MAG: hydroxypyruvate isomerase [Verrucomicrobia bacterium]|nr:MAG: hydroxypyruvate isomerase [Verrucomicrobiota bacterium]
MRNVPEASLSRRRFFSSLAVAAGAVTSLPATAAEPVVRRGRLKQGVCRGVFRGLKLSLEDMCREAARLGAKGMDLVGPDAFPVLKKYGLVPSMVPGGSGIRAGINDKANHAAIEPRLREAIKAAAAAGAPNVIVLAGGRRPDLTDEQGLENSVLFLNRIKPMAEDLGVTLCLELLNSKVNHPGYMADHTAWGVELCKRVNSPRVKLLYDIYHMQIMEGDIIRTIRENIRYIGHFHTAGNPGRHEFDETQELNYVAICRAIADLGFDGFLSHEYTPTRDPLGTLDRMMRICDV